MFLTIGLPTLAQKSKSASFARQWFAKKISSLSLNMSDIGLIVGTLSRPAGCEPAGPTLSRISWLLFRDYLVQGGVHRFGVIGS